MNVDCLCDTYAAAATYLAKRIHTEQEMLTRTRAGRRAKVIWSDEVRAYANAIISLRADEAVCKEHDHSKQLNDVE